MRGPSASSALRIPAHDVIKKTLLRSVPHRMYARPIEIVIRPKFIFRFSCQRRLRIRKLFHACLYYIFLAVVVIRYETTATARRALLFIVRAFFDDTITVAVWTGFHARLMGMLPHPATTIRWCFSDTRQQKHSRWNLME